MIPLPSHKAKYSDETLSVLTPTERQAAAVYGVGKQFLKFATVDFTSDKHEQYDVHKFHRLSLVQDGNRVKKTTDEQFQDALELLDSGLLWCDPTGIIVVNAPYFIFNGNEKDPYPGPVGFINHLLCSLAHRVIIGKTPTRNIEVNFLETMQLDFTRGYHLKPEHLLIYGPVTDHSSEYEYTKAIQFLFSFRNYTRILLTSTPDLGEMLTQLKINITHVSYFFNFDTSLEKTTDAIKNKTKKPKKEKPTIGI